uniref:Endocuticle structural glycoprotein ABD-4-like n=1 Tax=Diabrotica virgifera virgifera TaxID=50390 RepID=A0A6P7F2U4_DIAVI
MKLFIVCLAILSVCYGRPADAPAASGPPANAQPPVALIKYENEGVNADGSYQWSFEAANGIKQEEKGSFKPGASEGESIAEVSGQVEYTADDGTPIHLSYIANENGFQPQGDHLPTPPPIPEAIQKSLDFNAAHPQAEDAGAGAGSPPGAAAPQE